jgi:hypothetical protein
MKYLGMISMVSVNHYKILQEAWKDRKMHDTE